MKTIWKYPLAVANDQVISMPAGARILHVGMQGETPCLWAEVSPSNRITRRPIRIYGTGHELPNNPGQHLGSFTMHGGALVFHAYEPDLS